VKRKMKLKWNIGTVLCGHMDCDIVTQNYLHNIQVIFVTHDLYQYGDQTNLCKAKQRVLASILIFFWKELLEKS